MPADVVIQSFVLCEEIRREVNGSAIIIGATHRGPSVPSEGKDLSRLGFYIEAVMTAVEDLWIRLRPADGPVEIVEKFVSVGYRGELEERLGAEFDFMTADVNVQLMINGTDLRIPKPGRYLVEISTDKDSWQAVREYEFPEGPREEGDVLSTAPSRKGKAKKAGAGKVSGRSKAQSS